jgi:hypothetical protein
MSEMTEAELEAELDKSLAPISIFVPDLEHAKIFLKGRGEVIIRPSDENLVTIIDRLTEIPERELVNHILEILIDGGIRIDI